MNAPAAPPNSDRAILHGALFFMLAWIAGFVPACSIWPLPLAIPLIGYLLIVIAIPGLRATAPAFQLGRCSATAAVITAAIMLISAASLIAFDAIMRPNVEEYRTFLPVPAVGGMLAAGILFSLLNPVLEEVIFRGILFDAVRSQVGPIATILITAALFGIAHMHGYPPGVIGATLAFLYAIAIGGLRMLTGGLALPILAHVVADATIYVLIARTGVFSR